MKGKKTKQANRKPHRPPALPKAPIGIQGLDELTGGGLSKGRTTLLYGDADRSKALEEASRMATVVRDSNDAITIQDFEGRITAWNRGAERMFGYSETEALQMTIWQLAPPDKAAEQRDFNRRIFAGEAVTSLETRRLTKDGRVLDVWMTVTKLSA